MPNNNLAITEFNYFVFICLGRVRLQ